MFSTPRRLRIWVGALGASAVVGSLTLVYQERFVGSVESVHEILQLRSGTTDFLAVVRDAETGQRGFLLTGDDAFLEPYLRATRRLPATWSRLESLVGTDPAQAKSVQRLQRLSTLKLDELAETVELRRSGRTEEALEMVREGRGRRWMVELRTEVERMLAREDLRFAARREAAQARQRDLSLALAGVWGLLLCLVGGGIWSARRGVAEANRVNAWLARSEKGLRTVADNATDLVRIVDDDWHWLYVSPSCETLLGYTQAEVLDMEPGAMMHPDEREAGRELTVKVRTETADGKPFVHRLRTKSGEYRWFETTYCLVQEGSERTSHVHLTSRDVTERRRVDQELRQQTARLESILDSMADGVVVLDDKRNFVVVNPAARAYIHQGQGEAAPTNWAPVHRAFLLDGKTPFPSQDGPLTRALGGESTTGVKMVLIDRAGAPRSFSISARPLQDDGATVGAVAVYHEITEQRRAEVELQQSEQRLRVLSEASFEGIAITKAGIIVDANENFAAWLGRTREEVQGTPGLGYFAPEDRDKVRKNSQETNLLYEAHLLRRDGSAFPVEVRGRFFTIGEEQLRIAVIRDITDKRRWEAELKQQADLLRSMSLRDELTGLYNRRGFLEHADLALRTAQRARQPACVFFADLNGLKQINDTFGHEAGDRAIVAAARVFTGVFRDSDIVARLGGDEFAIFARQCGEGDVTAIRDRVDAALTRANGDSTEPFVVSVSVGASVFAPGRNVDLNGLMEDADRAMYAEKRARGGADSSRDGQVAPSASSGPQPREAARHE